jgi:universal stress protein E
MRGPSERPARPAFRRILVGVRDVAHTPRHALAKAGELARHTGARVELFHALSELSPDEQLRSGRGAPAGVALMAASAARAERALARMARAKSLAGAAVSVKAEWDYPAQHAIVRRARAMRADLLIIESHRHGGAARAVLANTDWELIRICPCPLLLAKSSRRLRGGAVIAALDPLHAHDKPARLDQRLLSAGQAFARASGGKLHAFHAYVPLSLSVPMTLGDPLPGWIPDKAEARHEAYIRASFARVVARARIPRAARHLLEGSVPDALATLVRRLRARVVVMGAVSRSGLRRLFIGSTAERVLDELECDVLIVKPRGFLSPVTKQGPPRRQVPLSQIF